MKPEKQLPPMSDDEKLVLELLENEQRLPLASLKTQSELSNKKWDKAIKGLTSKKLAKVEKTEEDLFVEVV